MTGFPPGFVSIVGAGPGDPELLTVKAVHRLRAADAVLYDDLASGPILELAGPAAELVSVGKRAGRPSPKQDHVNRLLVDYAAGGARVVRLKSGDPGIFGRLEEELTALRAAGIPFEIIPGISSATAAAAAAHIPLTRRLTARRLQFVTGHDVTGSLPTDLDFAALADPRATTAVFMPKASFAALADRLIAHGLPPDTPALLAENVSRPDEILTPGTVASIAAALATTRSGLPALILYGPLAPAPERAP